MDNMATSANGEPRFEQARAFSSSERVHRKTSFDSPTSSNISSDPLSLLLSSLFDEVTSGHRGPTPRDRFRDNNDPECLPNSPALQAEREAPAEMRLSRNKFQPKKRKKT